jgi:hypothetical protein
MKNDDAHKLSVHQGQMKTLSAMVHERIPMLIRQKNYRRAKAAAEYAITEFQDLAKLRPAWKSATDDMIRKAKVLLTEILKTDKKGNANLNQSDFELWLKQSEILYTAWDEANKNLKKITGDTKGALLPDKIKESNEYKIAKQAYQKAFKALQDFNAKSPKEFKRRASKFNEKKGNDMTNNLEAKKLAVIKSNAAPEVKLKALEKLNAQSNKPTRAEFDSLVNLLAKKLIMQKASAPLPKQQKASDAFLMKLRSFEEKYGYISSPDMQILEKHAERLAKSAIISGAGKDF